VGKVLFVEKEQRSVDVVVMDRFDFKLGVADDVGLVKREFAVALVAVHVPQRRCSLPPHEFHGADEDGALAAGVGVHVTQCHCRQCGPHGIETPTPGATEVLATARLGTQSDVATWLHWLCLVAVNCVAYSQPAEGSPP
jgi:hypothetical protein